jgi:3,5-epimerase/4-reductase
MINELKIIDTKTFIDDRGGFTELINNDKNFLGNIRQISVSISKKSVLRGMHCSPYDKIIKCINGSIFDVVVDLRKSSTTFLNIFTKILDSSDSISIFIPAGCAHGFYSYEDNSIIHYTQTGCYEQNLEYEINCLCPKLNIPWPKDNYIMSEKDRCNKNYEHKELSEIDFLIMGGSGMVGTYVIKALEESNRTFYISKKRLENYSDILDDLQRVKPKFMICCAGISGNPNIDWCETHKEETIMANVVGQINVIRACSIMNIHCTIFSTGVLYNGTHKKFTETDIPSNSNHFYIKMRIILEELINNFSVLNLRILYPITKYMHNKSIIPKLLKYTQVSGNSTSFTVMDDLFPLIPEMCDKKLIGTFNFCNVGTITNNDILQLYKQHVDNNYTWINSNIPSNRNHAELDVSKLLLYFPNIPTVKKSIENIMKNLKNHM